MSIALVVMSEQQEEGEAMSDELQTLARLARAGFRVRTFPCFVNGEWKLAWMATSQFLSPVYAQSLHDLLRNCHGGLVRALFARRGAPGRRNLSMRSLSCSWPDARCSC